MQFFRSQFFRHSIAFAIGSAIGALYFLSAVAANADIMPSVSIGGNGQVSVKGATVTAIDADKITAVSKWGGTKIVWTMAITRASRFSPEHTDGPLTKFVSIGERVGFSGQIEQKNGTFIVYPAIVRNESTMQDAFIISGNVIDTDDGAVLVSTENGTSTILVGTGTIMTRDGNKTRLSDLVLGETVKAFGTFNARARTLAADRILTVSLDQPEIPNTGGGSKQPGYFSRIVAWLGYGPLAVR